MPPSRPWLVHVLSYYSLTYSLTPLSHFMEGMTCLARWDGKGTIACRYFLEEEGKGLLGQVSDTIHTYIHSSLLDGRKRRKEVETMGSSGGRIKHNSFHSITITITITLLLHVHYYSLHHSPLTQSTHAAQVRSYVLKAGPFDTRPVSTRLVPHHLSTPTGPTPHSSPGTSPDVHHIRPPTNRHRGIPGKIH